MAAVSSYREASCLVRQRARSESVIASSTLVVAGYITETAAAKAEEGTGNGRSACPECAGLHAGYNGRDNGLQPREGALISETRS